VPTGAQVLRTFGINKKPLSSRNTRWAPRRSAFFYIRPHRRLPAFDGGLIPLPRPSFGLLPAPLEAVPQELPDAHRAVVDPELRVNQLRDALERPQLGRVPRRARPAAEAAGAVPAGRASAGAAGLGWGGGAIRSAGPGGPLASTERRSSPRLRARGRPRGRGCPSAGAPWRAADVSPTVRHCPQVSCRPA